MKHPVSITSKGKITSISGSSCYVLCPPISKELLEKIMPNKSNPEHTSITPVTEEFKEQNLKYNLSKFEDDLYQEECDVAEKVIRVKRVSMPNKGEKWKVMNDNKIIFIIEGSKLSKKEKVFLETVAGFNFILEQAKIGIKSLNSFKNELKKIVDPKLPLNDKPTSKTKKPKKK